MNDAAPEPELPRSVTSQLVSAVSTVAFVACLIMLARFELGLHAVCIGSVLILVGIQLALEVFVRKIHRRPTSGLIFDTIQFRNNFSVARGLTKLAGFYLTIAALALIYVLIPQYSTEFYRPFWALVETAAPYLALLPIPYFFLVDALMTSPRDGYWHFAQLCLFRWRLVDWKVLREFALGWVIKGFFLPLMTPMLMKAIKSFVNFAPVNSFVAFVYYIAALAVCIDLGFVVIGYIFTLRVLDSHIRSANPYWWGWVACITLYYPFWAVIGPLYFDYDDGISWYTWFAPWTWLLYLWGALIIMTKLGWAWSNVMFGFRFSNLTNRGVITNGPFRLTKHPSYLCKNVSWWLLSVPFLSTLGFTQACLHCFALLGINFLYLIRALSEELHLSEDSAYIKYALWINEHGVLSWLGRLVPLLRYRPPTVEVSSGD